MHASHSKRRTRIQRQARVRSRVHGTNDVPRLSVFRSVRHLSVQIIDDTAKMTLASASDAELAKQKKAAKAPPRMERAHWVGEQIAERASAKGIKAVRFDRGAYRYHGLVKAIAEAARKGGLKF